MVYAFDIGFDVVQDRAKFVRRRRVAIGVYELLVVHRRLVWVFPKDIPYQVSD